GRELTPVGCPRGAGDVREGLAIRLDDTVPAAPVVVHRIAVVAVFPGAPESVAALDAAVGGAGVVVDVISVVAVFYPEVHVAIPARAALAVRRAGVGVGVVPVVALLVVVPGSVATPPRSAGRIRARAAGSGGALGRIPSGARRRVGRAARSCRGGCVGATRASHAEIATGSAAGPGVSRRRVPSGARRRIGLATRARRATLQLRTVPCRRRRPARFEFGGAALSRAGVPEIEVARVLDRAARVRDRKRE